MTTLERIEMIDEEFATTSPTTGPRRPDVLIGDKDVLIGDSDTLIGGE